MRRAMTIVGSLLLFIGLAAPSAVGRTSEERLVVRVVPSVWGSWPGGLVTYTIVTRNEGRSTVSGATLTARMARGLSIVRISDPRCDEAATGRVTCALPDLAPGEAVRVAITAVVRPGVSGRLRTSVTAGVAHPVVVTGAPHAVVVTGAARAVVVTPVRVRTDLAVRLRIVHQGSRTEVIAATVRNRGPHAAPHAILMSGTDGQRILAHWGARCTMGGRVRCRLGRMARGSRRTVWFTVPRGAVLAVVAEPERGDLRPADNTALVS